MAPSQVQVPQKSLSWLLLAVTLAYKLLDTSNLYEYVVQLRLRACGRPQLTLLDTRSLLKRGDVL